MKNMMNIVEQLEDLRDYLTMVAVYRLCIALNSNIIGENL
jgi:hypothetical protein